ncbi:hypothetical protein BDN71DRAFT_1435474 [Pleurotus eryngii]|uniref:Uncharacterized protein n=1 Tax=Pleurotus eryngii TaxID=5323 RepID=A0A9P5ZLN0_PLEER|nr:hypothetical protein BDN71DRAFT_1435474 [Pleurotus eryngii]
MCFNTTQRPLSLMPLPDTLLNTLEVSEPGLSMDQAHDIEEEYILVMSMETTTKLEQQENTHMTEQIRSLEGLVMQAKLKVREAFQALNCSICLTTIKWPISTSVAAVAEGEQDFRDMPIVLQLVV